MAASHLLRVLLACLVGIVLTVAVAAVAPRAVAAQPIDWTIQRTFIGPGGEDVPLRIGQHDEGVTRGFGVNHILDRHGENPHPDHIARALGAPARPCQYQKPNDTWECFGDASERLSDIIVIFTEREDPRSGDGRPVGIITSYYVSR